MRLSRMDGRGRDDLPEGRVRSGDFPGGPKGVGKSTRRAGMGREAIQECQEGSGGPLDGPGGVGRGWVDHPECWEGSGGPFIKPGLVGRAGSSRVPLLEGQEGSGGTPRWTGGVGMPIQIVGGLEALPIGQSSWESLLVAGKGREVSGGVGRPS